jgi:hypothetical protein
LKGESGSSVGDGGPDAVFQDDEFVRQEFGMNRLQAEGNPRGGVRATRESALSAAKKGPYVERRIA